MAEFDLEKIKIGDDVYKIAAGGGVNVHRISLNESSNDPEAWLSNYINWDAINDGDIVIFEPIDGDNSSDFDTWYRVLNVTTFNGVRRGTKNRRFAITDGQKLKVLNKTYNNRLAFISTNCVTYCIAREINLAMRDMDIELQVIAQSSLLHPRAVQSNTVWMDYSDQMNPMDIAIIAGTWPLCLSYEKLTIDDKTPMPIKSDGSRAAVKFRYRFTTKDYYYYVYEIDDDDASRVVGFTTSTLSPTSGCNYAFCLGGVSGKWGGCVSIDLKYTDDGKLLPVYLYTGHFDGNLLYLAFPRN